jgi:hypothetical protein
MKRALATVFVLLCLASFTRNNFAQTSNASLADSCRIPRAPIFPVLP